MIDIRLRQACFQVVEGKTIDLRVWDDCKIPCLNLAYLTRRYLMHLDEMFGYALEIRNRFLDIFDSLDEKVIYDLGGRNRSLDCVKELFGVKTRAVFNNINNMSHT